MTPTEKRILLKEFIELLIFCGYDITDLMGRELSYFDFDKIKARIKDLEIEKKLIDC